MAPPVMVIISSHMNPVNAALSEHVPRGRRIRETPAVATNTRAAASSFRSLAQSSLAACILFFGPSNFLDCSMGLGHRPASFSQNVRCGGAPRGSPKLIRRLHRRRSRTSCSVSLRYCAFSSNTAAATQKTRRIKTSSATQDPIDLYLLVVPQSAHETVRIEKAPRMRRNIQPKRITYSILGVGRSTDSLTVFGPPQAGQLRPGFAPSNPDCMASEVSSSFISLPNSVFCSSD